MKKPAIFTFLWLPAHPFRSKHPNVQQIGEIYRIDDHEARAALADRAPFDSTWLHTLLGFSDTLLGKTCRPGITCMLPASRRSVLSFRISNGTVFN